MSEVPPIPPAPGDQGPPAGGAAPQSGFQTVGSPRNSGNAIASLAFGIAGFLVLPLICSILAIVFASMARKEIDADPNLGGSGLATAGKVLGIIGLVWGALVLLVFIGVFASAAG